LLLMSAFPDQRDAEAGCFASSLTLAIQARPSEGSAKLKRFRQEIDERKNVSFCVFYLHPPLPFLILLLFSFFFASDPCFFCLYFSSSFFHSCLSLTCMLDILL
jgi:hypothetical protein